MRRAVAALACAILAGCAPAERPGLPSPPARHSYLCVFQRTGPLGDLVVQFYVDSKRGAPSDYGFEWASPPDMRHARFNVRWNSPALTGPGEAAAVLVSLYGKWRLGSPAWVAVRRSETGPALLTGRMHVSSNEAVMFTRWGTLRKAMGGAPATFVALDARNRVLVRDTVDPAALAPPAAFVDAVRADVTALAADYRTQCDSSGGTGVML